MRMRPKIRNAALVGALAAITATAWATGDTMSNASYIPANTATDSSPRVPAVPEDQLAAKESLDANETLVTPADANVAPVVDRSVAQPPLVVQERRLSRDERIQGDITDKLMHTANLSGKIGVESHDAVVTLTGYTSTAGQAYRVGRMARSVEGVTSVDNQIRPRIGGSV